MYNKQQEIEWVSRAVAGDKGAFGELCRLYYEPLRRYVAARLVYTHLIDDVVQESFLRVYRDLSKHDADTPFWPFIQQYARRIVLEQVRAVKRERARETDMVMLHLAERRAELVDSGEDEMLDRRLKALETCFQGLSEENQKILKTVYSEGTRLADLAERMKIRVDALASRLYRLRNRLKTCVSHRLREVTA